jgi:hypothetical protein
MVKKHIPSRDQAENATPAKYVARNQPRRNADSDPTADELRRVMSALGKRGGPKGGKARALKLSGEERSAIAKRAAIARWSGGNNKD